MSFSNPIVGGVTLIRPAIQSPDYVAGATGWSINKDGSAEFNDVVIRGDGNGDALIVGPDNGPQVQVGSTASAGYIQFPTNRPVENLVATILAGVLNSGLSNEAASLQVLGPTVDGATDRASLLLSSQNNDGSSNANALLTTGGGQLAMDETLFSLSGSLIAHSPSDSATTAHRIIVGSGYTGSFIHGTKNGVTHFRVLNDGTVIGAAGAQFATDLTAGSITTGGISAGNIQKGIEPVTTTAGQWVQVTVNFPQAFTTIPVVTLCGNSDAPALGGSTSLYYAATAISTTQFALRVFRSTAITMDIGWIAIA